MKNHEVLISLSNKKKTSHILHLILSIISCGLWIPIWLLVVLSNSRENSKIDKKIKKGMEERK